jgi:hypothetical protein
MKSTIKLGIGISLQLQAVLPHSQGPIARRNHRQNDLSDRMARAAAD